MKPFTLLSIQAKGHHMAMPTNNTQLTLDDWFPVFRAGKQTDSSGKTKNFTIDDLDSMVESFDSSDPVPVVIGHPKSDSPAWGWIEGVRRVGEVLEVKGKEYAEEFRKWVADGLWRNRSVRIRPDDNGGYKLVHVGFLGAAPPAVKGLGHVYSNADQAQGADFDFTAYDSFTPSLLGRVLRNLREWIVSTSGTTTADTIITGEQIDALQRHGMQIEAEELEQLNSSEPVKQSFSRSNETMTDEEKARLKALEEENARLKLAAQQEKLKRDFSAVLAKAQDEHRLTPGLAAGLEDFAAQLDNSAAMEFAAESGTQSKTPFKFFCDFVAGLPEQKALKNAARKVVPDADEDDGNVNRSGHATNPDRQAIHRKALAYQKQNKGTTYMDAVRAVAEGGEQ